MKKAYELSRETGTANDFTADELLVWLIEAEHNDRQSRKMNKLV
jgi:hypothetical protein